MEIKQRLQEVLDLNEADLKVLEQLVNFEEMDYDYSLYDSNNVLREKFKGQEDVVEYLEYSLD